MLRSGTGMLWPRSRTTTMAKFDKAAVVAALKAKLARQHDLYDKALDEYNEELKSWDKEAQKQFDKFLKNKEQEGFSFHRPYRPREYNYQLNKLENLIAKIELMSGDVIELRMGDDILAQL